MSDVSQTEAFLHEDREWHTLEEEDPLSHLLLPDSLELLEKVERKLKKKRRNKQKKQRHRQFNDLWVRMEERWVRLFYINIFNGLDQGLGTHSCLNRESDFQCFRHKVI